LISGRKSQSDHRAGKDFRVAGRTDSVKKRTKHQKEKATQINGCDIKTSIYVCQLEKQQAPIFRFHQVVTGKILHAEIS